MGRKHFGDIDGLWLGHAQNLEGPTGVSVVLCPEGASAGVDVRGGAPGTRETEAASSRTISSAGVIPPTKGA